MLDNIPKHIEAIEINEREYEMYTEEQGMATKMGLEMCRDGLARCIFVRDSGALYMEKLKVTGGSDFGVNSDGIIRRFDLNI